MAVLRFFLFLAVKAFGRVFYKFSVDWVGDCGHVNSYDLKKQLKETRVLTLLNHTSLFEPIYLCLLPNRMLWVLAKQAVVPIADVTLDRPLIGRFLKTLAPKAVRLTRKRDKTWSGFMDQVCDKAVVAIAPEGRMRRLDGLDKNGQPMTVKGGIADVIQQMSHGRMLMLYSGGLHHVYAPGQRLPRVFKKISVRMELFTISEYKNKIATAPAEFTRAVVRDLEARRDIYCPEPQVNLMGLTAVH
ncbi:MAG: 1-acyl-sn-glycerol-3-phosphate acyltransferase [Oligoflexales bacterium]